MKRPLHAHQQGFTLIELMVAISVSTLLLGVLYQGLHQSLQQWQQQQQISARTQQQFRLRAHLQQQLSLALPGQHEGTALFQGGPQQLSFISPVQHPVRAGLYHYLLRLSQEPPYRLSLQVSRWPAARSGDHFILHEGPAPLQLRYGTLDRDGDAQWQSEWQQHRLPQLLSLTSPDTASGWVNLQVTLRNQHETR